MTAPIRILLADDHSIFRMGLSTLLRQNDRYKIVGEACEGTQAFTFVQDLEPDLAILDIRMPGLGGIDLLRKIRAEQSKTRVLLLSECSEDSLLHCLAQEKPDGYVLKSESSEEVFRAIDIILEGEKYYSPRASVRFLEALATRSTLSEEPKQVSLTEREREVAHCIELGMSNKEIAIQLGCSEHTVKAHKANAMKKLGVSNAAGIAAWSTRNSLSVSRKGKSDRASSFG